MPAAGAPERWHCTYWLHCAKGSAMLPLLMKPVFDKIEKSPMLFFIKPSATGIVGNVKQSFIVPHTAVSLPTGR